MKFINWYNNKYPSATNNNEHIDSNTSNNIQDKEIILENTNGTELTISVNNVRKGVKSNHSTSMSGYTHDAHTVEQVEPVYDEEQGRGLEMV